MFELLLNAATFVLSKETREGTNALFDALTKSPEWTKDICTIEARVPASEEERFFLLGDVVSQKMRTLGYGTDARRGFRTCARELISNAIEHGCSGDPSRRVVAIIELSPTYISLSIQNPRGTEVSLEDWLRKGKLAIEDSKAVSRGRGLQLVAAHADILQQVGPNTIKAILYRDRVEVVEDTIHGERVFAVVSGISNPSLPHRLTSFIRKKCARRFVVCLDPREYRSLRRGRSDISRVRTVSPEDQTGQETHCQHVDDRDHDDDEHAVPSTRWTVLIAHDLADSDSVFRIVLQDEHFVDLLPDGLAFRTIKEAVDSLQRAQAPQRLRHN